MTVPSVYPSVCVAALLCLACADTTTSPTQGPGEHPATPPPTAAPPPEAPSTTPAATSIQGTIEGAKATHVMSAHVRAMPPGAPATAAFFILHNPSAHDAVVTGGRSPAATSVELHTHIEEDGQFKMRQVDRIEVPAGQQVQLQPGGLHVMLIGLTGSLTVGESIPLTLEFEGGHAQQFDIPVQDGVDERQADHSAHAHHADPTKKADADPHAGHH